MAQQSPDGQMYDEIDDTETTPSTEADPAADDQGVGQPAPIALGTKLGVQASLRHAVRMR
jgi:hypothetical protein